MKWFLDFFRRNVPEPESDREVKEAAAGYAPTLQRRKPVEADPSNGTAPKEEATGEPTRATPNRGRSDEIVNFELNDFLPHIPEGLLSKEAIDPKVPIAFNLNELSRRIARGQTTLSLAEIYRRVPHAFRAEIRDSDNIKILFPWQRLLELVKAAGVSGPRTGLTCRPRE
jgi:hypothetical protein